MAVPRQVIALAGVGCLGKYVCEELLADDRFDVVVISRGRYPWFTSRDIQLYESDYSAASILEILDNTKPTTLISLLNVNDERYVNIHRAFLSACQSSRNCKRLIPSEYAGDVEAFPTRPRFYAHTRELFRQILRKEAGDVEWTLFQCGWFMDYFLPAEKSYMKAVPDEFPINLDAWTARIRGTGDEPQSWTLGREVGNAVVELCAAKDWEPVTYVVGQWGTFNEAVKIMESFYGRPLQISRTSAEEIRSFVAANLDNEQDYAVIAAMIDEYSIDGASACPQDKTLRQREKFFQACKFSTIEEVLKRAQEVEFL
ncbi:hypothetical protein MMC07_009525 [Pseudocyphellaria aurata]|nr:hypothetical protein [Pseudocyphellaria aurata]